MNVKPLPHFEKLYRGTSSCGFRLRVVSISKPVKADSEMGGQIRIFMDNGRPLTGGINPARLIRIL